MGLWVLPQSTPSWGSWGPPTHQSTLQMNKCSMCEAFGEEITNLLDSVNLDKSDVLGSVSFFVMEPMVLDCTVLGKWSLQRGSKRPRVKAPTLSSCTLQWTLVMKEASRPMEVLSSHKGGRPKERGLCKPCLGQHTQLPWWREPSWFEDRNTKGQDIQKQGWHSQYNYRYGGPVHPHDHEDQWSLHRVSNPHGVSKKGS